jgi:phosphatidylserine/phosphatidylglycerophosphate/cardiolipin synthase-like enzyme
MVVDDRLLRIGSSNLNNRSMGFDSECDVAIEAASNISDHDDVRRQITSVRHQLVSEHLGRARWRDREGDASMRVVAEGHRGTSRTRQDVAAIHREDSVR